ncbi:MAG: tripartite tricarboxylate transporter substrate binding protein [Hyphomicrobiales bacterium]|nr:tripartite tricarboxylate transporter substrate binding protein [Hyphomicrobiales bacterium]
MLGLVRAFIGVVAVVLATTAAAQTYPSGPVRIIVPIPAGGVTDVMARIVGARLQEIWGQTVIVENRVGGNSGVGAQAVERAAPDGLTLLVAPDSTFTANPAMFAKLIYDPDNFTPIAVLCRGTPMLIVHPSLPVKTVPELIAYAKANPDKLSYGSFGVRTYAHLSMEDVKRRTGIAMQHVPYRGAAPALNGILGNEVSVMLLNLSSVEAHAKSGRVRLIAAATEKRASAMPELPTIAETIPGFNTSVWFGLWGPPKLPPALLARIHADVAKALDLPETRKFFQINSFERVSLSPQEFAKLIRDDLKHWSSLIDAVGAKAE